MADLVATGTSTSGQPLPAPEPESTTPAPEPAETPAAEPKAATSPRTTRSRQPRKRNPAPATPPRAKASAQDVYAEKAFGAGFPEMPARANDLGWFLVSLMAWSWFVMPFLENGVPGVKKVLLAKFLNKRPDGSYLP